MPSPPASSAGAASACGWPDGTGTRSAARGDSPVSSRPVTATGSRCPGNRLAIAASGGEARGSARAARWASRGRGLRSRRWSGPGRSERAAGLGADGAGGGVDRSRRDSPCERSMPVRISRFALRETGPAGAARWPCSRLAPNSLAFPPVRETESVAAGGGGGGGVGGYTRQAGSWQNLRLCAAWGHCRRNRGTFREQVARVCQLHSDQLLRQGEQSRARSRRPSPRIVLHQA